MHLSIPIISSCFKFTCNFGRDAGNVKDTSAVSYFRQSAASSNHVSPQFLLAVLRIRRECVDLSEYREYVKRQSLIADNSMMLEHSFEIVRESDRAVYSKPGLAMFLRLCYSRLRMYNRIYKYARKSRTGDSCGSQ